MESSMILVTRLPDGTTQEELTIYFQMERDSGGSDVQDVREIDRGQAIITFENAEAAARVVRKGKHYIKGCQVLVSLLPETEGIQLGRNGQSEENENSASNNWLGQNNRIQGAPALASPQKHERITPEALHCENSSMQQCTIKVTGLPKNATKDLKDELTNYFENAKRSKGGPVSGIEINRELQSCLISFENPDDAKRTVEHSPHRFGSFCLEVSLLEVKKDEFVDDDKETYRKQSIDEEEVILTVSGNLPPKESSSLQDYFENKRRSGGGKVLSIDYTDEGDAVVTFADVKDLKRLLEGSHCLEESPIKVVRQPPKKKVPLDPARVHVQGFKTTPSKDNVRNYLEKFCDANVSEVHFGCNNNALVVFDAELDFKDLFDKIHKDTRGLNGCKPQLERVPLCTCIKVEGLMKETKDFTVELYFDNERRSGGGNVTSVERTAEDEALVYFEDPTSVKNVIHHPKRHSVGETELQVRPYYPYLEKPTTNKSEMIYDPNVLDYIRENHEHELQTILKDNRMELSVNSDTSILTVSSSQKKKISYHSWQERVGRLDSFLQQFQKVSISIASEIYDEIVGRWEKQRSIQEHCNAMVSFDDKRRQALIIGDSTDVDKERNCLQQLVNEVREDTELMKSIVEVPYDGIPKSRLTLLKTSGICERLQSQHQHLSISFEENGQQLCLKGPRALLQEVGPELLAFTSKVIEQTIPFSRNIINVLKRSLVSEFIQNLLKQRNVQALFVYDQINSSNEVQVVGVDSKSVEEATVLLQNAVQERSLHLTNENAVVLESRSWKDFHSNMTSKFKVGIFTEPQSNTVCVSGIAEEVKQSFDQVKHFLDANTILHNSLPVDQGITRFIVQKWGSKLETIKKDLATCFLEIKTASNYDGFKVSGTAEGLEKCLPKLQELAKAVQKTSVPVDKPATKKFILHGKGPECLKYIESSNQCLILVKEGKEHETPLTETDAGDVCEYGMPSSAFTYGFGTKEGDGSWALKSADDNVNPSTEVKKTLSDSTEMRRLPEFDLGVSLNTERMRDTPRTLPGISITVKEGDLSKEQADILVGTAAPSLNLDHNPCARALKNGAEGSFQQECTKKAPVREGDIAVINQTGKLNCLEVIFAVCSSWNGGKGKEVLKGLLGKCLQEADRNRMTSIAFAAIGTGNLRFPRDQVADIYFEEVMTYNQNHPNTTLKDVRFVLHDTLTFQAFQAAERIKQNRSSSLTGKSAAVLRGRRNENGASSDSSSAFSPVKERNLDHLQTTVGSICFQAQPGSITEETTDAIAVISNTQLDISASEAGAAILSLGGDAITSECSRNAPQIPGAVFVTTAGKLKARYLYHMVPNQYPLTPASVQDSVLKCLQEAELRGISSISFPVIGTGNLGMSAKSCARAMLSAIRELSSQSPKSLKLVKMSIFQKNMIKDVRSVMADTCPTKTTEEPGPVRKFIDKGIKKVAGVLGLGGKEQKATNPTSNRDVDKRKVDLLIFAGCEGDLQRAREAVSGMMTKNCKQQKVFDEAIKCLVEDDMKRIHTFELRYSLEVSVKKEEGCIVVDGLSDDIPQVLVEIYEILRRVHERSHAEMMSKDIQWMYKTVNGNFTEYESHQNAEIELAYHQKKSSVTITRNEEKHKIVFDNMAEEDEYSSFTAEVRRIDLRKEVEFPVDWVPQPVNPSNGREETVYLFQLDPVANAQEYKKVSNHFRQSCTNKIIKIERVQNPTLYGTYVINRQKMNKANARGRNEMSLFHGTKGSNCELINHKGFNRSLCGENVGALYGKGVYFAARASYSARPQYSPADNNGYKYMYLTRVLVGEYTVGKKGILTPPVKDPSNLTDSYDTVVDDVSNPSIFVVFYDWQCYPEYLITFQ